MEGIILTLREFVYYLAIFFVLLFYQDISNQTLKLTESMIFRIQNAEQTADTDIEPLEVEIPRKITGFRVVMERKLGIDYEHNS